MATPLACPKHPKEVTYLRCSSCGTPICQKCAVQSPVGQKCRDCGTFKNTELCTLSLAQALAAVGVGLAAGFVGEYVLSFIGFFGIYLAIIYGRFVGTLILKASGRKLGILMDVLTAGSILLGGLGLPALNMYQMYLLAHSNPAIPASMIYYSGGYSILIVIITAAAAVSRMRWPWGNWGI